MSSVGAADFDFTRSSPGGNRVTIKNAGRYSVCDDNLDDPNHYVNSKIADNSSAGRLAGAGGSPPNFAAVGAGPTGAGIANEAISEDSASYKAPMISFPLALALVEPGPAWIVERLARPERAPLPEVDGFEWDKPRAIAAAYEHIDYRIASGDVPQHGNRDDHVFRFLARMHGLGLSQDRAHQVYGELLDVSGGEAPDGWPDDPKTADKLRRIWGRISADNPPGSELRPIATETWADVKIDHPGAAAQKESAAEPTVWPEIRNARVHMSTVFEKPDFLWQDRLLANEPNLVTGLPGAGKTTLSENEAVYIAAGIPLFGYPTRPAHVYMLIGEDMDGTVRDNLMRIRQELGLDDAVLDKIDWRSVKSTKIPGGHLLASIDDQGRIDNKAFMRECIVPELQSYGGPVLFIVDPLEAFITLDRNKPRPAGVLSREWAEEICLLNNRQVTVQINDHPSNASVEADRHVSGDVQFRGGFSLTATLQAEKLIEVDGIKQKKLTYRTLKPRHAAETETVLYRIGSSPLLKTQPAKELDLAANMARVYRHVEERRAAGERSFMTNGNGTSPDRHGPDRIAGATGLSADLVRQALKRLVQIYVYKDERAGRGGTVDKRDPGGLMPGALASQHSLERWAPDMFVGLTIGPPGVLLGR